MLNLPPTPLATLTRARSLAMRNGVRYAYTGNVHDVEGGTTFCHQCGGRLIGRNWYVLTDWNITEDGRCRFCDTLCPGVFAGSPGGWDARRLPVRSVDLEEPPCRLKDGPTEVWGVCYKRAFYPRRAS